LSEAEDNELQQLQNDSEDGNSEEEFNDSDYYEEYLALDEEEKNPVQKELLDALPVNKFVQANLLNFSEENKLCTICQCNYEVGDYYMVLMCLHRFHRECVSTWF
jgi:hypothetical protein